MKGRCGVLLVAPSHVRARDYGPHPTSLSRGRPDCCGRQVLEMEYPETSSTQGLVAAKVDVNQATKGDGATALCIAARKGHASVVELLLAAKGVDVNQAKGDGATALFMAAQEGHASVLELLLAAKGVDVNQERNDGATALSIATRNGHAAVGKLLLAARAGLSLSIHRIG